MLTHEQLAAIRERAEKATAGPFKNPTCRGCYALGTACRKCEKCSAEQLLFAHAYSDIPALIAHVDELERYMSQLESALFDVQVHLTQTKVADPIIKTGLDVFQGLISSCYRATSILRRNSP